jgi:hypothetical protein
LSRALTLTFVALASSALAATRATAADAEAHERAAAAHTPPAAPADPVIAWNRFLLDLQAARGAEPVAVHPTYELAMLHAAIHDAVVAIDRSWAPYFTDVHGPRRASPAAAVDAAARDTLVALMPARRQAIDAHAAAMLARLVPGGRTTTGLRVGRRVAAELLAARDGDGAADTPLPFVPAAGPGAYQPTPPAFAQPVFTHWPHVRPFVLRRADQFRPPPAALTSPRYAAALDEVRALGAARDSTRTPEQTRIALFWDAPIWAAWNQIAARAGIAEHAGLVRNARAFAALNLTLADATIALYDAKYAHRLWRPVTAIRRADTRSGAATTADGAWTPLSATAPDPSYPGAHATISAAGAAVLSAVYGRDVAVTVTSPALAGAERSFSSFRKAAQEASTSRIFDGTHTRLDQDAGERLGRDVAAFVLGREVRP